MANVIENDQAQIKHHYSIFSAEIVLGAVWNALKKAHHVVGEIADGAGHERGEAGNANRPIALNAIPKKVQGIRLHPGDAALGFQDAGSVDVAKHFGRIGADEGVASDFFAALDAFEQAGVAGMARESQVGADGGEKIGRKGFVDRDEIALTGQAGKTLKIGLDHPRTDCSSFCNAATTTRRMTD